MLNIQKVYKKQFYKKGIKMNPIYLDLHIHTSENPNNLNTNYNVELLLEKIKTVSNHSDFLISLTDHNTINKDAYNKLLAQTANVILGTELHVFNYEGKPPYHCHIYFNTEISDEIIDSINVILDKLYENKIVEGNDDFRINIQDVIRAFDDYDFLLLPHGGQNHKQFHKSISTDSGVKYDSILERTIYYNQFDGFTARNEKGLQTTLEYFKKLGISEFTNLVTCSDNYSPTNYPNANTPGASEFMPTWMLAEPTFNGLRLSLSEASRLIYSDTKPEKWSEYIQEIKLNNDYIDIDVNLSPGLNVVIGGSSSGKTLFVDSLYRKLTDDFESSKYHKFNVSDIQVRNPSGLIPHYIDQNYIIDLINDNSEKGIDDIPIIKKVFPGDRDVLSSVTLGLNKFKDDLFQLVDSIETIETLENEIRQIPVFSRLVTREKITKNILTGLLPSQQLIENFNFPEPKLTKYQEDLNDIKLFLNTFPLVEGGDELIESLLERLKDAYDISKFESSIRENISSKKDEIDRSLNLNTQKQQSKISNYENLIEKISNYKQQADLFYETISKISSYSISCKTQEEKSMGHTLFIENNFNLSKEMVLKVINMYMKNDLKIDNFDDITPKKLYLSRFRKQNPKKITSYLEFKTKIYTEFEKMNKREYRITTKEGKDFNDLSAGWKTSVILDLLLGYEGDYAPLIIDQPEDNLATNYINDGLVRAIKGIKDKKQIILVSHNATIPMLGDAQTIVLCEGNEKIDIKSECLEGSISEKSIVDHIADITDGGKPAIKKRVKKYNLKSFKEGER